MGDLRFNAQIFWDGPQTPDVVYEEIISRVFQDLPEEFHVTVVETSFNPEDQS